MLHPSFLRDPSASVDSEASYARGWTMADTWSSTRGAREEEGGR